MINRKKKILYISGSRSDFGLMKEVLLAISSSANLELEIVVCGMHLMPEFGKTINEIKKDKFKIHIINAIFRDNNKGSMVDFIGEFILLLNKKIKKINPDIILLLGDRPETLAGAIVGSYLTIPVAHIHGGDVSSTVDNIARNAITKMACLHFPATKKSAERIIKMNEDPKKVFVVGAPGLDYVVSQKLIAKNDIAKKYNLDFAKPVLLVILQPVTELVSLSGKQMQDTMLAIKELGYQTIVIYPNADAGGIEMIKVVEKYRNLPFIHIYKNIPRNDFLSLLKNINVLIGNSSSGIIEAPFFNLSVVNIGPRQLGRERSENIIDVDYKKQVIKQAINKALFDKKFKNKVKNCKNPYITNGTASSKIVKILSKIKI